MPLLVFGAFPDKAVALGFVTKSLLLHDLLPCGLIVGLLVVARRAGAALVRSDLEDVPFQAVGLVLVPGVGRLVLREHGLARRRDRTATFDGLETRHHRRQHR